MNPNDYKTILKELDAVDTHLGGLEDRGILTDSSKSILYLVQVARPFLKVLIDIAQSLEAISKQ